MKKYVSFLLVFALMAGSAISYTRVTSSSGHSPRWSTMPVPFWINEMGYPQITNKSDVAAILASFHAWEVVPTADVQFDYRGTTTARRVAKDGMNIVTFTDDSMPLGSSTIAATFSYYRVQGSELLMDESDISFSNTLEFSTSGETNKYDIQSVLTHEVGHLLGLDHSGLVSSVMVPFSSPSQINQRTLAWDDIAGISEIYPKGFSQTGQIRGFVLNGTVPVFGAHVVAVDTSGTAWVSTVSQPTGYYALQFLPPGTYKVYAEPLDLPVTEQNVGGGSNSWYRNLRTDFATTYVGDVGTFAQARALPVTEGALTAGDIQVLPKGTTSLNLTRPAFSPRVARGETARLTVGGEDVTAGTFFVPSTPEVILQPPTYGGRISAVASTSAAMDLFASPLTPLGPKNVTIMRGTDSSVLSGAFVIVDPQPLLQSVLPGSGVSGGGSTVTIFGANFRPGASVYFGGLASSTVDVLDSTTIRVTAPQNVPGAANVQVINADGTNGVMTRGFNYVPPTPTLTGVTPTSGPPTTVVAIDGTQFSTRSQDVEVRFNGVAARVIDTTATRITAIVPYGATTGPVSVSVFGTAGSGNVTFDVTPVALSVNRAVDVFKFVDSSPASGGSNLTFQGPQPNDDGLSTIFLPFTFSLFNDIYLANSPVTVSTNGWLSLEIVSDPYTYQNGRLPGSSAVDAGGSARTIPPSLIAPFFDDLLMVPGVSSISTRVLGVAPNRQLVVQWSHLSILDDDGNDRHADVTFQTVLFEGSNDIQFVYQSMVGPRSDATSATIGIQNLARDNAVLTSFNQSRTGSGFYVTYRFSLGIYAATEGDTTPPTKPVVTDGGALTASGSELFAAWTAQDPESGIREYQYAIGRTAGATDVRAFTTIAQSSVTASGLTLDVGSTYFFAVRAINNAGLVSDVGLSDGIRIDPTYQPDIRIIPYSPQNSSDYSGIAMLAPTAMSVVLKAIDTNGNLIGGAGVQNPVTVSLNAGQQYARLIHELFGIVSFDGWIEIEASTAGLGVYVATGSWDMRQMDGSVVRDTSNDFVVFHPGASVILANPSFRQATVTITEIGTSNSRSLSIGPRSRISTTINAVSRVQSSEALAGLETFGSTGKLGLGSPASVSSIQASLVFPNAVTLPGYTTTLTLVNPTSTAVQAIIEFAGASRTIQLQPNGVFRQSIADFLQLAMNVMPNALRVTTMTSIFGSRPSVLGVVDIESASGLVSLGSRPASTDATFGHVAHGGGLFTGLSITAGAATATVTIDVFTADGLAKKSATVTVGANQQFSKLISEIGLSPSLTTQMGGYIRIHSDQPIWVWEIYGSGQIMASGPPM